MAQGKLAGREAVPPSGKSKTFFTNPHLKDLNQRGIGGMDPSVYLSVCCRNSDFAPESRCPLYKVSVPDHSSSLPTGASASRESLRQIARLETCVVSKTFISLPPSGWIIGVGGNPGSTIIIDTSKPKKVIRGPDLVAAKWNPILNAVGNKVYALCNCPNYIFKTKRNLVPWFEVLDLSKTTVTKAADGSLSLDGCSWEELSWPLCFPRRLSPNGYKSPPVITIRSYVVVLHYILISLNQKPGSTYAFDTISGEWHKIDTPLPFIGRATPHGHKGCVFLGSSSENGSVNAYHICVSTSSCSLTAAGEGTAALKLSITVCFTVRTTHQEVSTMAGQHIVSLDRERFSLLTFSLGNHKHRMTLFGEWGESYATKLFAKLTTYHIENPALLEETHEPKKLWAVKHEILLSKQQEQNFDLFSSYGFSSPPILFALSI
ncbi:hypothetical protein QOZ80_3AG0208580 [Eleusine coracana subsp. coracana]|nr:hypothetical protein QOZ80_3AG0208580 [Eleusine coracana subsp. coracana]